VRLPLCEQTNARALASWTLEGTWQAQLDMEPLHRLTTGPLGLRDQARLSLETVKITAVLRQEP